MLPMTLDGIYAAINMTNEDWERSTSAPIMLAGLYLQDPAQFKAFVPVLHRYFIACCWKRKHFIPQTALRDGLRGASKWINGEINDEAFWRLEWSAEAATFRLENIETSEEVNSMKSLISSIEELKGTPYETSLEILKTAAYFANSAMVYPTISGSPYVECLCTSKMLCSELLREFLQPRFQN